MSLPRSPRGNRMRHEVTDADTAFAVGSGDVPVLATPRLIAWMEAATVQSAVAFLETGQTTVGTAVRIEHRRATRVGGSIEITATPPREADGRRMTFIVQAIDGSGQVVAAGEIDRVIVDRDRFLAAASDADTGN
jgi:fluoroacetyl-CoA thioesterase